MDGELWIISGEIGQGKTRWCERLIQLAREADWQVSGVLSPGVFQEGYKVGIEALDLRSGERRLLARRRQVNQAGLIHTREWQFETETVEWGNTLFQQAVPCDLLVVDEIGPLELEQGRGWSAALPAIESRAYRLALVVIRPALLPYAEKWQPQAVIMVRKPVK
ncbi:MAG: nucleoside-triphosphatase [Chloroflexota bacterium]|jgi:nucleoside-triphosphatase THEP1|uniref:DUF2478 domain-containing protein n=1 Tax=Bellilinea caldifistulae TaxID=360411 RepID=A0A7C4Q3Z7_9CHLR